MNTKELLKDLPVFEIQQGIDNYQAALEVQKRVNNFEPMLEALKQAEFALNKLLNPEDKLHKVIKQAIKQAEGEA